MQLHLSNMIFRQALRGLKQKQRSIMGQLPAVLDLHLRQVSPGSRACPIFRPATRFAAHPRGNSAKFLVFVQDPTGVMPADNAEISVKFDQLGITGTQVVKDLWTGENLGEFTDGFKKVISRHGAGLYRISAK